MLKVTSSALSCPFLLKRGGMSLDWTCCWAMWFWFWLRKCWFWTCRRFTQAWEDHEMQEYILRLWWESSYLKKQWPSGHNHLVGLNERLGPHVELWLWRRGNVAAVAIKERVGAMASHSGRVPILNDPWAGSNPTACETHVREMMLPLNHDQKQAGEM